MPATKKKKARGNKPKGGGANRSRSLSARSDEGEGRSRPSSSLFAAAALAVAVGWNRLVARRGGGGDEAPSSRDMLARVRRSPSFELDTGLDGTTRTLSATEDIPADTVLVEIPRELMVWDLDAARDELVRTIALESPLFEGGGDGATTTTTSSGDAMSRRAALLSAYLALLRNDFVKAPADAGLRSSVARGLPSYEDFASYHPALADAGRMRGLLGERSASRLHLVRVRDGLDGEYDALGAAFATRVSREDYLACRLAVHTRSFQLAGDAATSEMSEEERTRLVRTLGIDFGRAVVSIEPVNDWMNAHANSNVKVGGYDSERRSGKAWTTKAIGKGRELINNYGKFYDHVLFGQYGFVPADGTGTSVASLSAHHDVALAGGELIGGEADPSSPPPPPLEGMASYLRYDYGHDGCVTREGDPEAFRLKRLKLEYLREIASDASRWALPLPPRLSSNATPSSTTAVPDAENYRVPSFGEEAYLHLEANALSASLPCRLIAMTEGDVEDARSLLEEDLRRLRGSSSSREIPALRLEELNVSLSWFARTVRCMATLASEQKRKSEASVEDAERRVLDLLRDGGANTLEWNAAHVRLEEIQSQEVLEGWALDVLDKIGDLEGVSATDVAGRGEPCPDEHTAELLII